MNLISIVIPLYNKEVSISRAINSVLTQNYSNFELIIVNDGSSDNSLKEVYKIKDERIRVFNIKNSGVSYARNFGIARSKSNFVCLLDADDEWHHDFLNEIISLIHYDNEASLYSCRYSIVSENGENILGRIGLPENFFGKVNNFFEVYSKSRSFICSSCVCINKDAFNKIGGFPIGKKTGEDVYVWLSLNISGYTCFSNKVLAKIHRDAENRTVTRVRTEVPYHLKYYLFENIENIKDLENFCLKNSILFAFQAKLNGDKKIFERYLKVYKLKSKQIYLFMSFLYFVPNFLIIILKKIRNNLTFK